MLNELPSSWHRKLTPAAVSVKLKLALVWFVGLAGVEVITGVGGPVGLTFQVNLAAELWLPAESCASTEKV